uniref:NADH dehydrogenase [ubiquinone] 1 alpha subcomplex subunit 1 n=1 Tax=Panagrellus redivivus TaxID=6233 RepID=A0A7E4UP40_PANRE
MWYEQFYSGMITLGFTAIAIYVSGATNYLDNGRLHRRDLSGPHREKLLKRDHRLTGNYYKISGLESIQDAA